MQAYTAHFESWLKSLSFWQMGSAILTFELRTHNLHLSLQHSVLKSVVILATLALAPLLFPHFN